MSGKNSKQEAEAKLLDDLVKNALDFLAHASEEIKKSPKYSMIHF